ncbi:hypothetical protein [Rhodoferax sediminis]|uniref:SGNH/GDSL hydrolase family protein n=1 Tax=Rhodoferax sediminis TaxID=2509614 RepID=A0A515D833_9BURK|nr:hypothetical protein [Rhodoferax sediminis]QDL36581.1 hypothetical protein EUB48_04160 [Rhodoferax sediminis]
MLLLEIFFQLLPVSTSTETGYYIDPLILSYPPYHHWTTSTGWDLRNVQRLESNNLGYVANRDFERNANAVALIGDSFVEASMLAAPDRPGAQLERALGGRPVFAMGNPGTALLDYAERIRFAHTHFGVRDFVVLMERGDVKQSLCGSGNINGPCLDPKTLEPHIEKQPPAGTLKRIFRHSALAQYVFGQLKFSPQQLLRQAFPPAHGSHAASSQLASGAAQIPPGRTAPYVDVVTHTFFERIKPYATGRLVIVIDSDRRALAKGRLKPDPSRARFIQLARAAGATVIDTEPIFQAHFARSHLSLDVGPYDGHFNALGVSLVTQAAATALAQP